MREEELQRPSQITEQLVELRVAGERLEKEIEKLEARLKCVLRETEPTAEERCDEKAPALVSLAQQLSDYTARIGRALRRLSDIHQRLEL